VAPAGPTVPDFGQGRIVEPDGRSGLSPGALERADRAAAVGGVLPDCADCGCIRSNAVPSARLLEGSADGQKWPICGNF